MFQIAGQKEQNVLTFSSFGGSVTVTLFINSFSVLTSPSFSQCLSLCISLSVSPSLSQAYTPLSDISPL